MLTTIYGFIEHLLEAEFELEAQIQELLGRQVKGLFFFHLIQYTIKTKDHTIIITYFQLSKTIKKIYKNKRQFWLTHSVGIGNSGNLLLRNLDKV